MKYLKAYLLFIIIVIISTLIFSSLSYIDIINEKINNTLSIIMLLISSIISGIYIGIKAKDKGYIEGIKIGLLNILIPTIIIIISKKINLIKIILILLIIIATTIGSIIGINKKIKAK